MTKMISTTGKSESKKLSKAAQKGAKVVFANTDETRALLDLTIEADKLFRALRKDMGTKIDFDVAAAKLQKCHETVALLSDFIEGISSEIEYIGYKEPSSVSLIKKRIRQ